jgi:hypothetical protein
MLRRSGWLPGRDVDTTDVVARLEGCGFRVSSAARHFLGKYYGLRFVHQPCLEIGGSTKCTTTSFDPLVVATERDVWFAERCVPVTGVDLCPVGTDGFHLTIYMSPDGGLWGGKDSYVYAYAEAESGLFEKMLAGERPVKIGVWEV